MRDRTQAKLDFIHKAMNGDYTAEQAQAELNQMEREFGELTFLPGTVTKKPRPWTRADLEDLRFEAAAGAGSRDFFAYLAEMGEEVNRTERRKRKKETAVCRLFPFPRSLTGKPQIKHL